MMSRQNISWFLSIMLLCCCHMVSADTGNLFIVTSSGAAGSVNLRLCLDGQGPTSCEDHMTTQVSLSIRTTIPDHSYPLAGIKSLTPGYSFTGCTLSTNGYCIFAANHTSAKSVEITSTTHPAALTSISPSSGSASGNTGVTLTGSNLSGATSITFGGIAATAVNVVNSTTVTAVTPSHAVGSVDIVIMTSSGSATLANGYTYNTTAIGQSSGGGVIACLNGNLNNLIAATSDYVSGEQTTFEWGGAGTQTNATSTTNGASNTTTIVNALGNNGGTAYAAQVCNDYAVDSQGNSPCKTGNTCYNDWFLPSDNNTGTTGQQYCLYTNRATIGGFSAAQYWSSTEIDANFANGVNFSNGSGFIASKSTGKRVRCVRAFTP